MYPFQAYKSKARIIPQGIVAEALHLPVTEQALISSTTHMKNVRVDLPDYEFGYVRRKVAYDEKQAGYFSIPVKEIIRFLETSVNIFYRFQFTKGNGTQVEVNVTLVQMRPVSIKRGGFWASSYNCLCLIGILILFPFQHFPGCIIDILYA